MGNEGGIVCALNGHGENATPKHESAMAALPSRAGTSLQAGAVQQADGMPSETPASPPNPSPARGRGEHTEKNRPISCFYPPCWFFQKIWNISAVAVTNQ